MYVIGLTGNIGTGKSTVAGMLAELGAEVIDADVLSHELMAPGLPVNTAIVARFGAEMRRADGTIDRPRLGALAFRDPAALRDLEAIVHPAVLAETARRLAACTRPVAVVEAIKLIEAGMAGGYDAVWVVTADRATQIERLVSTRGLTVAEAELRVDAQPPAEEKLAHARVVIDNAGTLAATREQVRHAWAAIPGVAPVAAPVVGGAPIAPRWAARHPRLAAWPVLAVAMAGALIWAARGEALAPAQLAGLAVAAAALAGICIGIVGGD